MRRCQLVDYLAYSAGAVGGDRKVNLQYRFTLACTITTLACLLVTPSSAIEPAPIDQTKSFFLTRHNNALVLMGTISSTTLAEAKQAFAQFDQSDATELKVTLMSPGGDATAAMEIGRLLRERRAEATVADHNPCASACLLVLAGASERNTTTGEVILQRPVLRGLDAEESRARLDELGPVVREYLQEMNVSPELWNAMLSADSLKRKALSQQEQEHFGLLALDPVEAELRQQSTGSFRQIKPSTRVQRKALGQLRCQPGSGAASTEQSACLLYFEHDGDDLGLSVAAYARRWEVASTDCEPMKPRDENDTAAQKPHAECLALQLKPRP